MKTRCLALLALLAAPLASHAELSINGNGTTWYFQSEPGTTWTLHRQGVPTSHVLNPFGDSRGDGAPSIQVSPATGAVEVAWSRAGAKPGVAFAWWVEEDEAWRVLEVPVLGGTPSRVVSLAHDTYGNRYIAHDDPARGTVLLASAQFDGHALNRPIRLNETGRASSPSLLWDGQRLVVAFARLDVEGGLEIVELEPEIDADGRIPNGGEGVPGIPEPVFQYSPSMPSPLASIVPGHVFPPVSSSPVEEPAVPPLVRVEALGDGRLLATWLQDGKLGFTVRSNGAWGFAQFVPLPDPVRHEDVRDQVRHLTFSRGRSGR